MGDIKINSDFAWTFALIVWVTVFITTLLPSEVTRPQVTLSPVVPIYLIPMGDIGGTGIRRIPKTEAPA